LRARACCLRGAELRRSDRGEADTEREKSREPSHFQTSVLLVLGVSSQLPARAWVLLPIQFAGNY